MTGIRGNGDIHPLLRRGSRSRRRLSSKLQALEVGDLTESSLKAISVLIDPIGSATSSQASRAAAILGREVRAIRRTRA